ncbi:MAG: SCO family protein [Kangiellaceae bacterium]|jgi:protein SCO1/2|nr:SCO family protein [Kangiellaceae bacterium]
MGYMKQTLVYGGAVVAALLIAALLFGDQLFRPKVPKHAMVYPKFKTIESFELDAAQGKWSDKQLTDKWTFMFFGYTYCPDICPTTLSALKSFYNKLPPSIQSDSQIVLVSVDPERDTPDVLKQYTEAFDPSFVGITSSHEVLKPFVKSFGVVYYKVGDETDNYLVDHSAQIFLIDPAKKRHAIFKKSMDNPTDGYEYDIDQMVNDYLIIRNNYNSNN